jgi:hypothetical protein
MFIVMMPRSRWLGIISPALSWSFLLGIWGIPYAIGKLPRVASQPPMDRVADALLAWKGCLMHKSGWLTLVQTTLSSMSIYTAINLHLPHWLLKPLVKTFKAFLWSGMERVQGSKCMVAWNRAASTWWLVNLSGLDLLDLNLVGRALRLC